MSSAVFEVPPLALGRASILVVDQVETALAEDGDLIRAVELGIIDREMLTPMAELVPGGSLRPQDQRYRSTAEADNDYGYSSQHLQVSRNRRARLDDRSIGREVVHEHRSVRRPLPLLLQLPQTSGKMTHGPCRSAHKSMAPLGLGTKGRGEPEGDQERGRP